MEGKTLPLPLGEGFGRRGASVRSWHQPLPPPSVRFAAQVLKEGRDWLVQRVAWTPASGRPLGFCLDLNVRTARAIAQSTGGRGSALGMVRMGARGRAVLAHLFVLWVRGNGVPSAACIRCDSRPSCPIGAGLPTTSR
jgi:hypothetical protein